MEQTKQDTASTIRPLIKIRDSDLTVLLTGSIVTYENRSIEFIFNPETNLVIKVSFKRDGDLKTASADVQNLEPNGIEITLRNLTSPLGNGSTKHLRIGHIDGKEFYFAYKVFASSDSKVLHYTFLTGKEVSLGK